MIRSLLFILLILLLMSEVISIILILAKHERLINVFYVSIHLIITSSEIVAFAKIGGRTMLLIFYVISYATSFSFAIVHCAASSEIQNLPTITIMSLEYLINCLMNIVIIGIIFYYIFWYLRPLRLIQYSEQLNVPSCTICLQDYLRQDFLYQLKCGHSFHKACLDEWFETRRNCPLCRSDYNDLDEIKINHE